MTRTIQDSDLRLWEVYASSGDFGSPDRARVVFHCLTDPGRRARYLDRDRGRADVEQEVATLSEEELGGLLEGAREVK
jgi:hypothetical protein